MISKKNLQGHNRKNCLLICLWHQPIRIPKYMLSFRRKVASTRRGDTLQQQIASCVLENFCENLCRCNRICRHNKSHIDFLWLVAATNFCCGDKDFHKNSPVHTERSVAATCRLTLLLQLVVRPVHTEWSVTATCCSNLSPSVYRPS